jgi:Zn-dependent metalloprotease
MKSRPSLFASIQTLNLGLALAFGLLLSILWTGSGPAVAQVATTTTAPVVYQEDPFVRMDNALVEAAKDPIATAHVERAMRMLAELKLEPENTLHAINATIDDAGNTHVRLQQRFRGLRVIHGTLISHSDAKGKFLDYTDALKRGIQLDTKPKLSEPEALDIAAEHISHQSSYSWKPRTQLVVYPIAQLINLKTGEPVQRSKKNYGSPFAVPDELRAEDTEVRVKEYRLAYEVRTVEGIEGKGAQLNPWEHFIDANTGEFLSSVPLSSSARHTGHGTGANEAKVGVSFETIDFDGGFRMEDSIRKFHVLDEDRGDDDPENKDANNQWGNGLPFKGDGTAGFPNRQTAMVDAMFGSRIYWDLMNNVFKRKGPDGHFYSVNVFVHSGTNWNDDKFYYLSGNIALGDGDAPKPGKLRSTRRQAVDCLGHENGHGLQHFTASLGGCGIFGTGLGCDTGEPDGLNESDSDIWGAMTALYLNGGGFAAKSMTIPPATSSSSVWQSVCSGRDLRQPSSGGQSDFWFPGIGDEDPHDAAAPNNRAFFFLAQGASAFMKDPDFSPLLPWGMAGLGTQTAARIWFLTLVDMLSSDATYKDAFHSARTVAFLFFIPSTTEGDAVQNAYAGIGVANQLAASYPKLPPTTTVDESTPHNTRASAIFVARPTAPKPPNAPDKITLVGSGTTSDVFRVSMKPGESITARLVSVLSADYDLFLLDKNSQLSKSINGPDQFDQITFTAPGGGTTAKDFFIRVHPFKLPLGNGQYVLSLDFF